MNLESLKMNHQSLKSSEKMKKAHKSKEKSTKNANIFCRNKPNYINSEIAVSPFKTGKYEISPAWRSKKANPIKPNLSQIKPNSNPMLKRPKMNLNPYITMNYKNFTSCRPKKQTQTNPFLSWSLSPSAAWNFFPKFLFFKDFLSTSAVPQTPYIKNKIMTRKCNNCQHFIRVSAMNAGHVWGDCMKPGKSRWDTQGRKIPGSFTWADKSCDDFKPQNTSVD